jgi:hypothetical protein
MEQDIIAMTTREAERLTIINNLIAKKINGTDAAKQLHLSIRQAKRLKIILTIKKASTRGGRESDYFVKNRTKRDVSNKIAAVFQLIRTYKKAATNPMGLNSWTSFLTFFPFSKIVILRF